MLYQLDKNSKSCSKVKRVTLESIGWKEIDLQKMISNRIQDLLSFNELMTIFNERPRQEEPDILALDRHGDLYIFELKRWSSQQENLLQVLRYGQLYGSSRYDELNEMYQKYTNGIAKEPELKDVHEQYFEMGTDSGLKTEDFNRKQHFVVVTNGLDQKTVEAIAYWKKNGLNIDAVIYWVFEINGQHFIEFNQYSPIEGFLEYESSAYVLNTNFSNNSQHTQDMLDEKKAAAYYPGWREKIAKLQKGDTVFLYQSGVGIIAYGIATGKLEKRECDGHPEYEYCMKLDKFSKLKKPFSAADMKACANQGFNFRQTMFSIGEEAKELLIREIQTKHR